MDQNQNTNTPTPRNQTASRPTVETPATGPTPTRKRKADLESKKGEVKKLKPTYTPRSQARRQLKKASVPTPVKNIQSKVMQNEDEPRPVMMNDLRSCFDELGKSLSSSLTKDFTRAISVVGDQVNNNTKNIESIRTAIKRIEEETTAGGELLSKRFENLEMLVTNERGRLLSRDSESSDIGQNAGPDMRIDQQRRSENVTNHERFCMARRSIRVWPVPGATDDEVWREGVRFMREKMQVSEESLPASAIQAIRRTKTLRKTRIRFEALIILTDRTFRDVIASHGKTWHLTPMRTGRLQQEHASSTPLTLGEILGT